MTKHIGNRIGIALTAGGGGMWNIYNQFFYQKQGSWPAYVPPPPPSGLTATGGVISDYTSPPGAVYRAHVFTSSGTFTVSSLGAFGDTVEYLVVGGGGGTGTRWHAGAGGAGGLLVSPGFPGIPTSQNQGTTITVPATVPAPYSVIVGAGGAGAAGSGGDNSNPPSGGNPSSFGPVSVNGGGYGGTYSTPGGSGGSGGGGGGGPQSPNAPATNFPGPTQQGFPGGYGDGDSGAGIGGGGGGAGGAGQNYVPPNSQASHGGLGLQVLIAGSPASPQPVGAPGPGGGTGWFAGGGGAGFYPSEATVKGEGGGPGGPYAGGGPGGPSGNVGVPGTFATGGGGGSPSGNLSGNSGSNGGSGIVVVRYQIAQLTATAKATGGSISFAGGKTIHTFLSSGTFTITNPSLTSVSTLIVAGGGAGGNDSPGGNSAGGGGAGGLYYNSSMPVSSSPGSYPVSVGAGGAMGGFGQGPQGTPSSFNSITMTGGGGGGAQ